MTKLEIKKLLGDIENPVILEIGANDGSDSLDFCNTFKDIQLYCFEPDPRAIELFEKRFAKSEFAKNIKLYQLAISDQDGEISFWMSNSDKNSPVGENWNKSGSIKQPTYHLIQHPWCKFDRKINVKTLKLDSWIKGKDIPLIHFAWIDVQGAEKNLIDGGINTINEKVMYIYTEYSKIAMYAGDSSIKAITTALPNFELVSVFENDILLKNKRI